MISIGGAAGAASWRSTGTSPPGAGPHDAGAQRWHRYGRHRRGDAGLAGLWRPARGPAADPGLRQRAATGADVRHAAGLGHRGPGFPAEHRLPDAGGHGLYVEIPLGAAGGPLRTPLVGTAARLGLPDAVAAGWLDRRHGPVRPGIRAAGAGPAGGLGGL